MEKLSSKYVYENPWMKVREDKVIKPDGKEGVYSIVEQRPGVLVIPVSEDGKIGMIRNNRYIYGDEPWELPCGDVDEGEKTIDAAQRELREELGMSAGSLEQVGTMRPSPGRMLHETHILIGKNLSRSDDQLDREEVLERAFFSIREIDEMITAGKILDAYVMTALYFYKLHRGEGKEVI